ncbi:MAG: glutaminase [Lewinella sp.]|nr:glutaminase [Lewinella sp.]
MQTRGFYDEAGEFAYRVGLPGKMWSRCWASNS